MSFLNQIVIDGFMDLWLMDLWLYGFNDLFI